MTPCWVFLVTVLLKHHPRRALALLLRNVGGTRRQEAGKDLQKFWRNGHIHRLVPILAMDLVLGERKEQAVERAQAGNGNRSRFQHPGKKREEDIS